MNGMERKRGKGNVRKCDKVEGIVKGKDEHKGREGKKREGRRGYIRLHQQQTP